MAGNASERPAWRTFIKYALVTVVALLVVYGALLGFSVYRVKGLLDEATQTYAEYEAHIDAYELGEAIDSLQLLVEDVDKIQSEALTWEWQVASHFPVLGEDVECLRSVVAISDQLARKALMPVLDELDDIVDVYEGSTEQDLDVDQLLSEAPGRVVSLVGALLEAREQVADCNTKVDALPRSHFETVNEFVEKMRNALEQVSELLDGLEPLLNGISELSSLFTETGE